MLDSSGTAEAFIRAIARRSTERVAEPSRGGMSVGWHAVPDRSALLGLWSGLMLGRSSTRSASASAAGGELDAGALRRPATPRSSSTFTP